MAVTPSYKNYVLEQLERIASITSKSMFGGIGIYADGIFFALIGNDQLFFKVSEMNLSDFEAAGMGPFRPYGDERSMNYYEVTIEVLEDVDQLKVWAMKAVDVARHAKRKKK